MSLTRRAALLMTIAMAACSSEPEPPPQDYPQPHYDYLPQIRMSVSDVEIDDSWAPRGAGRHVENLAPVTPRDALRQMGQDRLFASGGPGRAVFVIEDASIIRATNQYLGTFAVRVDIADAGGNQLASATARGTRTRVIGSESRNGIRSDLYGLVTDMMADMNVELEYQLRRALKEAPQATRPASPEAEPVQIQDLSNPGAPPVLPPSDPQQPAPLVGEPLPGQILPARP
jgi:hypothetical protein